MQVQQQTKSHPDKPPSPSSLDFRPAKIKQSVRAFVFNFHGAHYLNRLLSRGEPGFCSLLSRFVDKFYYPAEVEEPFLAYQVTS